MIAVVKWVHLVALGVWLGSIVFFSFCVAPLVFTALPRADAGRLVSAIFPLYYYVGYGGGGIVLLTALLMRNRAAPATRTWAVSAVVAGLMLALTLYAGLVVQPRAHALRAQIEGADETAPAKVEFDRLHRLAVQLNGSVLLGTLVLAGLASSRMRP
jgi:hypothetical protein